MFIYIYIDFYMCTHAQVCIHVCALTVREDI